MSVAEKLRQAVKDSGETHYRIGKETGIAPSVLDRFAIGESEFLGGRNIEKLCDYFGLELAEKMTKTRRNQTAKKPATKRKRAKKASK